MSSSLRLPEGIGGSQLANQASGGADSLKGDQ